MDIYICVQFISGIIITGMAATGMSESLWSCGITRHGLLVGACIDIWVSTNQNRQSFLLSIMPFKMDLEIVAII